MNAPIAPPDHGTLKTSATATVTTASSGTPQRIDDFIKHKLSVAGSAAGSGIIDSSARAAQLGFVNAANVRYSKYLEAFRSSPQLTETYREKYPNSLFLPWKALHAVIKVLDLWVDLPEHYTSAVPSEQLPWMEIFELDPVDIIRPEEVGDMLPDVRREWVSMVEGALRPYSSYDWSDYQPSKSALNDSHLHREKAALLVVWEQARSSFFVVAPPEAFSTTEDWLERFRRLIVNPLHSVKIPPNDPLVIRFCRGGALVVAAWGDEAAELNEITKALKL